MEDKKTLWIALVVIAIIAVPVALLLRDGPVDDPDPTEPSSSASDPAPVPSAPSGSPSPSSSPTRVDPSLPDDATEESEAVKEKLAGDAISAYLTFSYADPNARSFLDRTKPYVSEAFLHDFIETFGNKVSAEEQSSFDRMADEKRETRVEVRDVWPSGQHENTSTRTTYHVEFIWGLRTVDTDGWTTPSPQIYFVTMSKKGSKWLVDAIEPMPSG